VTRRDEWGRPGPVKLLLADDPPRPAGLFQ
jgi:hypothetical protein